MELVFILVLFVFAVSCIVIGLKLPENIVVSQSVFVSLIKNGRETNDLYNLSLNKNIVKITKSKGFLGKEVILIAEAKNCAVYLQQEYTPKKIEIVEKNKSVFARTIIGGLLFGTTGAIIGGLSTLIPTYKEKVVQKEETKLYLTLKNGSREFLFTTPKYNNSFLTRIYETIKQA